MKEFAIFCVIAWIIQFFVVCIFGAADKRLFNHDLGQDFPTQYAFFLILVPGSFVILSIIKYLVIPMVSAVKFVINFVPNALKKRKFERKMIFNTIETKYDRLTKEAYDA